MRDDLISGIELNMSKFSKGQKLIAKYIIENYEKASFMTALKIGTTVGVSESTVVRFAMELGYDGYPQLQKAMQEMTKRKLTSVQRIKLMEEKIRYEDVLNNVLNKDIEKIKKTKEEICHEDFHAAVDTIVSSKKIYILAARSSSALATFLGFYFNLIFDNVKILNTTSENEIYEQLFRIDENDVIIGISFPRYSRCVIKAMEFANDRKAKVISITDSKASPLTQISNYALLAKSDVVSVVDSLVAPLSLINALIVATALKNKKEVTDIFMKLENIWEEYDVYEKIEDEEI